MEPNSFERLSPAQQHAMGLKALELCFQSYDVERERFPEWQVHETSLMAIDSAATALYRSMSTELHYLLSSAVDHLDVVNAFWSASEIPPFAPFTLIRSAIECFAYGLWVQEGGTVEKRIIRLLHFQWEQRANVNTYTAAAGMETTKLTEWFYELLTYTKDQKPRLRQYTVKEMPSITDVLLVTDRMVKKTGGINGLAAWRICSGVAHGNQHFASGLMRSEPTTLPNGTPGTSQSVSLPALAMVSMAAVDYMRALLDLIYVRSQPQSGGRIPVPISGGPKAPKI